MLAFHRSVPSVPLSPSHSPPTLLPLLILLSLIHRPSPFREWRRRGAAGRLRRRLGSGGGPPRPGPRWVLGAATPEADPGSPAPRPGERRGLVAAGYTEDVFLVGSGVALVGVGLPALQEVDIPSGMPTCFA